MYNYKDIKSIIIGGGNSKYVDFSKLKSSLNKAIYMLNKNHLQINSDLVCLLGLASLANNSLSTKVALFDKPSFVSVHLCIA